MQSSLIENEIDTLFKALADTTRRKVLELLSSGDASVKELAAHFTHALPSFMQHLRVLEECGLITSRKKGRTRTCSLDVAKLDVVEEWITQQHALWESRLDQLDLFLQTKHKEENHERE